MYMYLYEIFLNANICLHNLYNDLVLFQLMLSINLCQKQFTLELSFFVLLFLANVYCIYNQLFLDLL